MEISRFGFGSVIRSMILSVILPVIQSMILSVVLPVM